MISLTFTKFACGVTSAGFASFRWAPTQSAVAQILGYTDWAIQIPAQQTRIEIDVLNLCSAGDLTIFHSLAFMEIPPNPEVRHRDFLGESTSLRPRSGSGLFEPGQSYWVYGGRKLPT